MLKPGSHFPIKDFSGTGWSSKMKKLVLPILAVTCLISAVTAAFAQSVATAGSPSLGMDMWNGYYAQAGLFTPHSASTCNNTEAFVSIPGSGSTPPVGYCIETSLRNQGVQTTWLNARNTCTTAGKRLPEPSEWQYACAQGAFNFVKGTTEYTSNFAYTSMGTDGNSGGLITAMGGIELGGTGCYANSYTYVNNSSINFSSFRCVH